MQTFLPYADFQQSAKVLDYKRLGKQRVEALQIHNALTGVLTKKGKSYKGWLNHPAVTMWRGYEDSLLHYKNVMINEWIERGYNNTMEVISIKNSFDLPHWLGDERIHASHRSNLLRKDRKYYSQFKWHESDDLDYYWV